MREGRLVALGPLTKLREDAALPLCIRLHVRDAERSRIASALSGDEMNGQTVNLTVLMTDKMKTLAQIAAFGDAIEDVELIQPSLDDLYIATVGKADGVDGSRA